MSILADLHRTSRSTGITPCRIVRMAGLTPPCYTYWHTGMCKISPKSEKKLSVVLHALNNRMNPTTYAVVQDIRRVSKKTGLSHFAIIRMAGFSSSANYSQWKNGKNGMSPKTMRKIRKVLEKLESPKKVTMLSYLRSLLSL